MYFFSRLVELAVIVHNVYPHLKLLNFVLFVLIFQTQDPTCVDNGDNNLDVFNLMSPVILDV